MIPKDAAFNEFHDAKGPPNDRFVFTQTMHFRNGNRGSVEALHDRELTFNRVGGRQKFGDRARLGPHDITLAGGDELVGGVALSALE